MLLRFLFNMIIHELRRALVFHLYAVSQIFGALIRMQLRVEVASALQCRENIKREWEVSAEERHRFLRRARFP